jgi:RNA-directed DNA polymerase
MSGTPSPGNVSTKLERIAKRAKEMPGVGFTTLGHHIDIGCLLEAYRRTRRDPRPVRSHAETRSVRAPDLHR